MRKNPLVAATLNFLIPGLGYLYVGSKRLTFCAGLLLYAAASYVERIALRGQWPMALAVTLLSALLAFDAWEDARGVNQGPEIP